MRGANMKIIRDYVLNCLYTPVAQDQKPRSLVLVHVGDNF